MSRHLRGVGFIAQSAVAGPSSRPISFQPRTKLPFVQQRNASIVSWVKSKFEDLPKPTEKNQFEDVIKEHKEALSVPPVRKLIYKSHTNKNPDTHKISPRKLNLLANQIAGLPIDEAIVQMQFSVKTAARWIKKDLEEAKEIAIHEKGLRRSTLIVSEAYVQKGVFGPKMVDIKARGRFGIKRKPYARLQFTLKEGLGPREKEAIKLQKDVIKYARGAATVREDTPLRRKVINNWAW